MKPVTAILLLLSLVLPAQAATRFTPVDLSVVFNNDGVATAEKPNDGNFDAIGTTPTGREEKIKRVHEALRR